MKKILVLAMVTFGAILAHAGSFQWMISYSGKGKEWSASGALIYLFNGDSLDTVMTALESETGESLKGVLGDQKTMSSAFTVASSAENAGAMMTPQTTITTYFTEPTTMFWLIATNDQYDATTEYLWTELFDPSTLHGGKILTEADFAALPEPGVLSLLALGVSALALRRRAK